MLVPSWLVWVMVLVGVAQVAALWGKLNEAITQHGRPSKPWYVYIYYAVYRVAFWFVSVIGAILHGMDAALFKYREYMLEPLPRFLCDEEPQRPETGRVQV